MVQSDSSCAYHTFLAWSKDGGSTWDGGGGLLPGTAATAYEVDPSKKPQTDLFPAIAAGDPGKVDVAWLGTNETEPTDPLGKFDPGGCAGPGPANGNPTFYPPACSWNLRAGQSLNLSAAPGKASCSACAGATLTCLAAGPRWNTPRMVSVACCRWRAPPWIR